MPELLDYEDHHCHGQAAEQEAEGKGQMTESHFQWTSDLVETVVTF